MLPTKTREVTLEGNARDARFPGHFVQRSAFAKSFLIAIGDKMSPANSKDTPAVFDAHSSDALYIPRLEDGGFWTVGHHLGRSQIVSFAIHGSLAVLIALLPLIFQEVMPPPRMPGPVIDISVPQDQGSYV